MTVRGPGGGVEFLGEGLDNLTYVVNGELVIRFSKEPEQIRRAELIHTETRLLAVVAQMARLVRPDEVPLAQWREEATGHYAIVASMLPGACRGRVEAFLSAAPPGRGGSMVFCHNDLGIEHILAVPATGAITGVIDWSDAAFWRTWPTASGRA